MEGAQALVTMLEDYKDVRGHKRKLKEIEHRGDMKTHDLFTALNATFITPLDREDIAALASSLDDVLDYIYDTAKHLFLYEVEKPPKELLEVAILLHDQTRHLQSAMRVLPDPAKRDELRQHLVEVHSLENQADDLTDRMKAELFHHADVKHILKMKDVLEYIELATDKAEDAADVMRDILVKHQ